MRKIVVDVYGADNGIEPVVLGVCDALKTRDDFDVVFVGDELAVKALLDSQNIPDSRYSIIHTDKFITNDDPPTCVFGGHDDCSMVMAYDFLKQNDQAVAMLSAGNTGALLVGSICRLGLLQGLKYPALSSALPCMTDNLVCLVDCGGNMDCSAADLVRYAKMGNAFSKSMCRIESPRIGLLSVGREDHKGNALTKEAFSLIKELPLNFIGNVEGYDLVMGQADVIVADGFAGNILLKNTEAAGKAAIALADAVAAESPCPQLEELKKRLFKVFDFNSQGGATFLGPQKTVVKMHGSANRDTAHACIDQILRLEDGNFISFMKDALS